MRITLFIVWACSVSMAAKMAAEEDRDLEWHLREYIERIKIKQVFKVCVACNSLYF